jgi:hypothetical protein
VDDDAAGDWPLVPEWLDGCDVIAVFRSRGDDRPGCFIVLDVVDDRGAAIRDFRHLPCIGGDASIEFADGSPMARTHFL